MTTRQPEPKIQSAVYELLSLAFLYPKEGASKQLLDGARELRSAMTLEDRRPFGGLLDTLCGELQSCDDGGLEDEYIEVFGHTLSTDCSPYESEYGQAHVFQKSHTLADLSTFYQAFGVSINPELKDRLDHISVEMEFMHLLTLKEAYARGNGHGEDKALLCRQAQEKFLANHLGTWIKASPTESRGRRAAQACTEHWQDSWMLTWTPSFSDSASILKPQVARSQRSLQRMTWGAILLRPMLAAGRGSRPDEDSGTKRRTTLGAEGRCGGRSCLDSSPSV